MVPHLPLYLQDFDYKFSDSFYRLKATAQSGMRGHISPRELSNEKNDANVRTKTAKLIQLRAEVTAALLVHVNHLALGTCLGSWYVHGSPKLYVLWCYREDSMN